MSIDLVIGESAHWEPEIMDLSRRDQVIRSAEREGVIFPFTKPMNVSTPPSPA